MLNRIKNTIKVFMGKSKAVPLNVNHQTPYCCPVCGNKNVNFLPLPFYYFREKDKHQFIHSIFLTETINYEFYSCSLCKSSDRDRLYALYFNRFSSENPDKKLNILDIAPAAALTKFLKSHTGFHVRTADLFMKGVDDIVDITNMTAYADESFDAFICSHVLEHIEDDISAMKELYRVLAKDGWGIAMVPINLGLENIYEDSSVKDEAGRWKHFGQNDHIRMYSKKGFVERLQSAGFIVKQFDVSYFGAEVFHSNGIHPRSVLYIVNK
jgi:predicted SAM-dependent methyltransferase